MYKGQSGMWSWLLHRVTGLGILLFLFVHIVDISLLGFGPVVYDDGTGDQMPYVPAFDAGQ